MGLSISSFQQTILASLKLLEHIGFRGKLLMLTHNFKLGETLAGCPTFLHSSESGYHRIYFNSNRNVGVLVEFLFFVPLDYFDM